MPNIVRSLQDKSDDHSDAPRITPSSSSFRTKLVVHFDINETILVGDEAGGDTRDDCLNKILAKSAFVHVPPEQAHNIHTIANYEPTHWWDGTPISVDSTASPPPPPPLYTGWEWPPNSVPYYRTAFKKRASTFTTGHGNIYRELYNTLQANVAFPYQHTTDLPEILSHIIPSFFYTLQTLMERPQPTRIIFRTFGTDLALVAQAISCFAQGKHPDYPNFKCPDLHIDESNLFRGRWNEHGNVYQLWSHDGTVLLATGGHAIVEFLTTTAKPCCGIQDDYEFWAANNCAPWAGKPIWVPSDKTVHHVLFDDNIHNLDHDGIASVHEQQDGTYKTLTSKEILKQHGLHLIRVPTVEPIINKHWFLDQLDAAQQHFHELHHGVVGGSSGGSLN